MNVPNRITCGRLVIALLFFFALGYYRLQEEFPWNPLGLSGRCIVNLALVLFLLAVVSDALDGYIARKLGQVTVFGRIADPFVDKVVICGAFTFLSAMHKQLGDLVWPSMVVLILGREFLVTSVRALLESQGEDFSASFSGKAKMVIQSTTVGWVLLYRANFWPHTSNPADLGAPWARWTAIALVWITIAVTLASGVDSILRAQKLMKGKLEASI